MYVIVQNILEEYLNSKNFDCFDLLTSPNGIPLKFNTEKEAIEFLHSLGIDDSVVFEEGFIKIDRVH
tara:strand:- start:3008 stop:3208 length:201 start_codon:yes stop_codon:yes gene_type:complete